MFKILVSNNENIEKKSSRYHFNTYLTSIKYVATLSAHIGSSALLTADSHCQQIYY